MRTRHRGKQQAAGLEPEIIDGDDDEVCITMVSPPPNRPARLGGSQDGLSAPGDSVAPPPCNIACNIETQTLMSQEPGTGKGDSWQPTSLSGSLADAHFTTHLQSPA